MILYYYKKLKLSLMVHKKKTHLTTETLVHTVEDTSQSRKLLVVILVKLTKMKVRAIKKRLRLATTEQYKDKYYNT